MGCVPPGGARGLRIDPAARVGDRLGGPGLPRRGGGGDRAASGDLSRHDADPARSARPQRRQQRDRPEPAICRRQRRDHRDAGPLSHLGRGPAPGREHPRAPGRCRVLRAAGAVRPAARAARPRVGAAPALRPDRSRGRDARQADDLPARGQGASWSTSRSRRGAPSGRPRSRPSSARPSSPTWSGGGARSSSGRAMRWVRPSRARASGWSRPRTRSSATSARSAWSIPTGAPSTPRGWWS